MATWHNKRKLRCDDCGRPLFRKKPKISPDGKRRCKWCYLSSYSRVKRATDPAWAAKADERSRVWHEQQKNNPAFKRKVKDRHLRREYGLSIERYELMLESQRNVCAICNQRPPRLAVDHSHASGMLRDLLCDRCNLVLGKAGDDATLLLRAAEYLISHQRKHDVAMLRLAYAHASVASEDPSTEVGAVLVVEDENWRGNSKKMKHILAANRLPPGIRRTQERLFRRPDKYMYFLHAEESALIQAASLGHSTNESTIYCPWGACARCAGAISTCGVKAMVYHQDARDRPRKTDHWREEIAVGDEILRAGGVELRAICGKIGGCRVLFDGALWEP